MSVVGEMLVVLGASTAGFSAGIAEAETELKGFGKTSSSTASGLSKDAANSGSAWSSAAKAIQIGGLAVAAAAVGIGAESVKSAMTFQDSMTTVQNNLGATASQTTVLGSAIESAAMGTTSSANTWAAALAPVAGELQRVQGGALSAAAATQDLTAAQDLAESANIDVGTGLKAVADLEQLYGQTSSSAAVDANLLFEAQARLGTGADDLTSMMQKLQPKLVGTGMDLQDVLAVMSEMEPVVGTGTRAMTTVGTVLQSLASPSSTAQKALAGLGISTLDASGKLIPMPALIDKIQAAYDKLPAVLAKNQKGLTQATFAYDLFGKQAQIGTAILKGGSAAIDANAAALASGGDAADAAAAKQKTLSGQFETLKASLSTMATELGTALLPALTQVAQTILPIVDTVAKWIAANPKLSSQILLVAGAVGALLAATKLLGPVLGPVLNIGGKIVTTLIGSLLGGIPEVAAASEGVGTAVAGGISLGAVAFPAILIALIVGALILLVEDPSIVGKAISAGEALVSAIASGVGQFIGLVGERIGEIGANLTAWFGPGLASLMNSIGAAAGAIVQDVLGVFQAGVQLWVNLYIGIPMRIIGWVAGIVGQAVKVGKDFTANIVKMGQNVVATILAIPGQLLSALVNGFANLAQQAAKAFVKGLSNIPGAVGSILGQIPGVSLLGGAVNLLPKLAAGGVVTAPTIALVGEAGPEAVIPLSALSGGVGNLPTASSGWSPWGEQTAGQALAVLQAISDAIGSIGTSVGATVSSVSASVASSVASTTAAVASGTAATVAAIHDTITPKAMASIVTSGGNVKQTAVATAAQQRIHDYANATEGDVAGIQTASLATAAARAAHDAANLAQTDLLGKGPSGIGKGMTAFAAGGIVTHPTVGLIGEAGPEAVVPLGRSGGMSIDELAAAILKAVRQAPLVGTINVNNPEREPTGRSVADQLRSIGQLGLGVGGL